MWNFCNFWNFCVFVFRCVGTHMEACSLPYRCTLFAICDTLLFINILFVIICLKTDLNTLSHEIATTCAYICARINIYIYFVATSVFPSRCEIVAQSLSLLFCRLVSRWDWQRTNFATLRFLCACDNAAMRTFVQQMQRKCFLYIYATFVAAKSFCAQKCCVLSHSCHCCCCCCCWLKLFKITVRWQRFACRMLLAEQQQYIYVR